MTLLMFHAFRSWQISSLETPWYGDVSPGIITFSSPGYGIGPVKADSKDRMWKICFVVLPASPKLSGVAKARKFDIFFAFFLASQPISCFHSILLKLWYCDVNSWSCNVLKILIMEIDMDCRDDCQQNNIHLQPI